MYLAQFIGIIFTKFQDFSKIFEISQKLTFSNLSKNVSI